MSTAELTHEIAGLRKMLVLLTKRFTLDRDESEDLVQDTLLKALMYRDKFRDDTNLKGWLFIIMRNTFINHYHRSSKIRVYGNANKDAYFFQAEDLHTFRQPLKSLEFKEMWKSINELRTEFLIPFKMHATGYKYNEIADRLRIPIGTVKNRIFHARKEIQKKLSGYSVPSSTEMKG